MAGESKVEGPDLGAGVPLESLPEGEPVAAQADGEPLVVVRRGQEVLAIGATCTHYGGPLAEGLVVGETVRCPWHHACFSLRTGEALEAPALNPVDRWRLEVRDGRVFATGKEAAEPLSPRGRRADGPESVVIVGAGAAGSAAAEMLRRQGYDGPVRLVDPDEAAPYDRPNLSKDYLAGEAPEEWIPLRPSGFYEQHGVERVDVAVTRLDPGGRRVELTDGRTLSYGALLLATGARPVTPPIPGMDLPSAHLLRSLADCRALIRAAEGAERVVVLGASFIGMEVAASLRQRGLEVTVVAPEEVPFARSLGPDLGGLIRGVHEEHGVRFRLGHTAAAIEPSAVRLDDGSELPADLVVVGVGVKPDTSLAREAGLEVDDGVLVDGFLRTSDPAVWAAGDIARFPHPLTGERIRIEHWVVAQRQGQAAARAIVGRPEPFLDVPFFWTRHWDLGVDYVGHAAEWDETRVEGSVEKRDCAVRFLREGQTLAVATVGRSDESLRAELELATRSAS